MVRAGALGLGLCLGHVGALLGLSVPLRPGAVVDVTVGIDPNLAVAGGGGSSAGAFHRRGRR